MSRIIAHRVILCTLEFMDQATVQVVEDYMRIGLPTDIAAFLLIEQDGPEEVVERDLQRIAVICEDSGAREIRVAATEEEGEALRTARRTALSTLARLRPTTILEDATVPRA